MFKLTLCMHTEIVHIMNIDVPASVGPPPPNTQLLPSFLPSPWMLPRWWKLYQISGYLDKGGQLLPLSQNIPSMVEVLENPGKLIC